MMIITYKLNWNMLGHSMYFYDEMAGHYQPFVTGHFDRKSSFTNNFLHKTACDKTACDKNELEKKTKKMWWHQIKHASS